MFDKRYNVRLWKISAAKGAALVEMMSGLFPTSFDRAPSCTPCDIYSGLSLLSCQLNPSPLWFSGLHCQLLPEFRSASKECEKELQGMWKIRNGIFAEQILKHCKFVPRLLKDQSLNISMFALFEQTFPAMIKIKTNAHCRALISGHCSGVGGGGICITRGSIHVQCSRYIIRSRIYCNHPYLCWQYPIIMGYS